MAESQQWIDGLLVQWGDRLFYPPNRIVRTSTPRLANAIRRQIAAVVSRRVPQVMVKVTGGGRGMKAIAAHFRYISKAGRLEIEDELGLTSVGRNAVRELADTWRHGGARLPEEGNRREALNIMLSMPRGTDPLCVLRAAREFAQSEFKDHRYVMVLHDHQANPHVHLSVKVASRQGHRLNPKPVDLRRWRGVFAEKLQGWGIEAGATSRASRGTVRGYEPLWRLRASAEGRLRQQGAGQGGGASSTPREQAALEAWQALSEVLDRGDPSDRALGRLVRAHLSKDVILKGQSRAPLEFSRTGISQAKEMVR